VADVIGSVASAATTAGTLSVQSTALRLKTRTRLPSRRQIIL